MEFALAPFGIIGLETALALTLTQLVRPGHISLEDAVRLLSCGGAQVCNIVNAGILAPEVPADVVVFDPNAQWTITPQDFASKSSNSPFIGQTVYGKVLYTLCDGNVVYSQK